MKQPKILIVGGAGYIGSVLVRQLLKKNYKVGIVDIFRFGGESLLEIYNHPNLDIFKEDIRNTDKIDKIISKYNIIVNLAAIVGDPACNREPDLTRSINVDAAINLYKLSEKNKCKKFIFASTCSNYGKMKNSKLYVSETSDLVPLSLYAQTKVEVEKYLLSQNRNNICHPTCLRFSTAYGIGPKIRFDLTVNEFTKDLAMGKELLVYGEQFWRPYCHIVDIARAVIATIEAPNKITSFAVFNVGSTKENYTKQMIVDEVRKNLPKIKVKYVLQVDDPRDYRVNFDKIKKQLKFKTIKNVPNGIKEIIKLIKSGILSNPDDEKYKN
ncbi:MAG: NAD(P)-dependent oxidoreductase [Candidatus Shapirobacteria bacterium]|nr:NAD(P)-dependent oxidoreductase [Candidatus Shapirobacteria bacterium]MDD4383215.1 NAD(P)-dependent oxidoreductase [Candidatus Shapirobacteria bacterium]